MPALLVSALAGTALAQSLPSTAIEAKEEPKPVPPAGSLEPTPFARPAEDAASKASRQDAGSLLDRPDGLASAEADGSSIPRDASPDSPQAQGTSTEDNPAFLRATINQIDIGDVFVILREKDLLVKVSDLEKPSLRVEGGKREKHGEDLLVSLRSLAPRITFVFDERALTLTVTADSKLFGGSTFDLRAKRPEGIIYDNAPSMFVNYLLGLNNSQNENRIGWNGFGEAGLSLRGHLLYASGQRSTVDGSWERLLTNLTFDLRDRLTSIILGDANATGDALSGGAMLGGMSVARNFGLDPYYVFFPTQQLSGTTLTPSTVEVYVNGQLVRREALPPGQFSMQNLPVTSGSGETRVVIRDAFGNAQTMVNPYYMALGTLAKGLQDFSYNAGFVRESFGRESWHYGQPAFLARHRYGLTDWLTAGVRAEGSWHVVSGGPSLALRLPVGELGVAAAVSGQDRFAGAAALLSYSYVGRLLNFQVGVRYQSKEYATLNLAPSSLPPANASPIGVPSSSDRQRVDVLASIARNINKVASLSLQNEAIEWRDAGWNNRITLAANRTLTRWMYAFGTVSNIYSRTWPAEFDMFLGLSFVPAERTTASVTRSDHWGGQSAHGGTSQATLQQSLPLGWISPSRSTRRWCRQRSHGSISRRIRPNRSRLSAPRIRYGRSGPRHANRDRRLGPHRQQRLPDPAAARQLRPHPGARRPRRPRYDEQPSGGNDQQ